MCGAYLEAEGGGGRELVAQRLQPGEQQQRHVLRVLVLLSVVRGVVDEEEEVQGLQGSARGRRVAAEEEVAVLREGQRLPVQVLRWRVARAQGVVPEGQQAVSDAALASFVRGV